MHRRTLISVTVVVALLAPVLGCGPNCQKILSAKKPEDLAFEDSERINGLVERRKSAIAAAEGGNMYVIEDAKRTVTACEMAIEFQLQIGNLAKDGSPLYEKNLKKINDARCFLNEVLESKGKLIGTGKEAFISGSNSRKIRSYHEEFSSLFGKDGAVSERRLVDTYKKGVKAKKSKPIEEKAEEGAAASEGDESSTSEEKETTGDDDWGEVSDEGESEEEEGGESGSMDAF